MAGDLRSISHAVSNAPHQEQCLWPGSRGTKDARGTRPNHNPTQANEAEALQPALWTYLTRDREMREKDVFGTASEGEAAMASQQEVPVKRCRPNSMAPVQAVQAIGNSDDLRLLSLYSLLPVTAW